ncbi:MATE family efflux transporter [Endomicrobium proavitum]|uniref:Multidrug export protein MepA n=1 Tax=Endomicrobium proavitum TaxID=1408281 RepID=A0A0G3WJ96_9BACT|nr:MATE family efflux transporter [Endomicrobium proavitum]AKL98408.1 MATE efflux family protein [Endomicrobium proavitum]
MKIGSAPLALGTTSVGKLLAQYAIPAIIGMVAMSIYNITDSIFIGHGVGHLALAGLAITFPIMNLGAAFGALVGVGSSALLSIRLGQKDYDSANYILGNVITLNLIMGIGLTIPVLIWLTPILKFFGASDVILPYAKDFMFIIVAGNVIIHMYMGLNALIRSSGHPRKSMYATIATVVINLILNPLFIFVLGWGIKGSAFATIISQFLVLLWEIYFFSNKSNFLHFKSGIYKLKGQITKGIISIGLAPFLLNAASCAVVILLNRQFVHYGGDLAVGAYGIVNRVAFLFVMVVFGINQGMQPIVGYNYGAALYGRVKEALKKSIAAGVIVMTFGFALVELFPHAVASIFSTQKELVDMTVPGLRLVFMFYSFAAVQIVTSAFFQSVGKAYISIFLSITRQVIFLIPLILILPKYLDITGVWLSMPIADILSFSFCAWMLIAQLKKFKTLEVSS